MYEYAHAETAREEKTSDVPLPWLTQRAEQLELPSSTVEYGVTIAASLAQHFVQADREVGFLSYGTAREVVQPDRGERQLTRLSEILAVIRPEGRVPMAQALASDGAMLARHTTLIVITASTDDRWVTALRGLRARGVHGVGVFMAARTFGPAPEWEPILANLQASGLPAYLVKYADDLPSALGHLSSGASRTVVTR
jgi:uncharacterized protein (DUF58 family)